MRNKRLDVLRGVAVSLVLLAHAEIPTRVGWVGVDLFFVFSGFLISGLLFAEYKKHGSLDFRRFFIRRGLKIYPAFYALLLATLGYQLLFHQLSPARWYLYEMLYVQNYTPIIWGHTWSLAVEEHFYILLPLFLLLLIRRSPERADPFEVMPRAFLVVAATCLMLRVVLAQRVEFSELSSWRWLYATTHCRLDALFFGVLLGYLQHFRPAVLDRIFVPPRNRVLLACTSAALLAPCFFFELNSRFMLTIGVTLLYLGFGMVLMLSLRMPGEVRTRPVKAFDVIGNGFAYVGVYSYSIYLWHLPVHTWGLHFLRRILRLEMGPLSGSIVYVLASIACGILMSKLIEYPVLRLRDRVFPSN